MPGLESPFLKYGVDLGFWGHMHYYERFYPVANKKYWNSPNCYHNAVAPTYVLTGSARKEVGSIQVITQASKETTSRINQYGYTIMTVANSTHIHLEQISIDKDEAVVDEFWLSKDAGFVATEEMRSVVNS
ncbi:unnamed protein product [Heligmosomoides polygyrus]|uniref:Purple acid phosphatase C-terminal domain-containing protein n=1 Tax=Heligmosomoides polygyrus TaxID=6339 RepID=A0A3P7ZHQ7_HELPZ|nr:unnamed protein product [Heligmosomoides polygyrus]